MPFALLRRAAPGLARLLGRPAPAPPAPPAHDPLAGIRVDDGLPVAEWIHAHDIEIAPLDGAAAAELLRASVGPAWTGPAQAPDHALVALAVLAQAGGLATGADRAVDALLSGDAADARRAAGDLLSAPGASAFLDALAARHGHVATLLCGAFERVLPEGRILLSDLSFLRALDRPAWYALAALAGGPEQPEGAVVLSHYAEERAAGRAMVGPRVAPVLRRVEEAIPA